MMRANIVPIIFLVASGLAGCATPPSSGDAALDTTPTPASRVEVDLAFDGTLGTGVFACAPIHCHGHELAPGESENLVTPVEGRLRSIELTMTWTAATPATAMLHLGLMIMDQCTGCNITMLGSAEGPSPLVITANDLDYGVNEDNWFHYRAWNPVTQAWTPVGGAAATPDQAFSIVGKAVIEPVGAGAAA